MALLSHRTSPFHFPGESVTLFSLISYGVLVADTHKEFKAFSDPIISSCSIEYLMLISVGSKDLLFEKILFQQYYAVTVVFLGYIMSQGKFLVDIS